MSCIPVDISDTNLDPQDQLLACAIIIPIIATSDKTPMTRHTRGPEIHPLFIAIENIDSDIHMKATSHAWQCVAFIPMPKFKVYLDYQTILQAQLWHKCVDLVFENLKKAAHNGNYKLFFSHILVWCKEVMGKDKLDSCFKSSDKCISMRQFYDRV